MGVNARRGQTGNKVEEAGTYQAESGELWSYVPGDVFREDPKTHKSCVWTRAKEPDHPGGNR